jgi:DNA-binding NarL/FixJ family response regulator
MMGAPIRVLIVDDHPAFRRGIREIIADEFDMLVVGEASDAHEAVRRIRELGPGGVDIVLMDIDLPGMNGIEATRTLLTQFPSVSVGMLTVSTLDQDVVDATRAGAVGFLSKTLAPEAMVEAIRELSALAPRPAQAGAPAEVLVRKDRSDAGAGSSRYAEALTPREREVIELLRTGSRNREIAERLVLEESTVKRHVRNILRKLGARNRTEAAMLLRREEQ